MTSKPKPAAEVLALVEYHPDELNPYHANARRGDLAAIARSLETNGQYRPIVVNLGRHTGRPLEVLAGNHTLAAARQLGWTKIAATTERIDAIKAAREAGHTWRQIAAALDMTERGVMKLMAGRR